MNACNPAKFGTCIKNRAIHELSRCCGLVFACCTTKVGLGGGGGGGDARNIS